MCQCSVEYNDDGSPDLATVKPLVDGGTEGFKGHARVLIPGVTPCFECTLWLFPPQTKYPLCTLAETPRSAPHCIEYAKIVSWPAERPGEEFDSDNASHMMWIYEKALSRAAEFGIPGVTYQLTQGVVKNIIPAIASTNAIIAGICALETLKLITMCSAGLDNMLMYVGTESIYTLTSSYERDHSCPICGPPIVLSMGPEVTLNDFIERIMHQDSLKEHISAPSISCGHRNLYMRGVLEQETRGNLVKVGVCCPCIYADYHYHCPMPCPCFDVWLRILTDCVRKLYASCLQRMVDLVGNEALLTVNDKKLVAPIKVKLHLRTENGLMES